MLVQVTFGKDVAGSAELIQNVESIVQNVFSRRHQLTRMEVHLNDENSSHKTSANDKRCVLEARLAGHQPVVVHHNADSLELALDGAIERLERALEHTLGKLADRHGRVSMAGEQSI